MTSSYQTGTNPENEPTRGQQRTKPASSEVAYELLSAYGFARRYAKGKTVADLGHEEIGRGSLLLAQSAESVRALTDLPGIAELASSVYYAPNLSYQVADLPKLPLPGGHFDVVVAFGVIESLEHPEELVEEAKRVLKQGGVLLLSVPDKRTDATNYRAGVDGQRGMYVPDFRGLLERHFGHVRLYRQGAVAGGFVFPVSEGLTGGGVPVESVRLSLNDPRFGVEPPTTRLVMAVCSDDAQVLGREERPYLLLDHDRRVFDECEEYAEDVELLRDEIRQMQETEVQAFVEAMSVQQLPLGALLRMLPQLLVYYWYNRQIDYREVNHSRDTVFARARHRWETTIAETHHGRDATLARARHRWETTIAEARHRRDTVIAENRRAEILEEAHQRRNLALEEARRRRNLAIEEARRRRDTVFAETRHRQAAILEGARHRRNLAIEESRHRRNLIVAEIRHRRNLTLERIIHRQNIIRGNIHALRQKDARSLARGVLRRLSALYRREGQKP